MVNPFAIMNTEISKEEVIFLEGIIIGVYGNWLTSYIGDIEFQPNVRIYQSFLITLSLFFFVLFFLISPRTRNRYIIWIISMAQFTTLALAKWFESNSTEFLTNTKFSIVGGSFWLLVVTFDLMRTKGFNNDISSEGKKVLKEEGKNEFEILYEEFPTDLTEKHLDKMLDHLVDIKKRTMFWLLGVLVPIALLTYELIDFIKKNNPTYALFYEVIIFILWIVLGLHYRKTLSDFNLIEDFRSYMKINQKIKKDI